MTDLILNNSLMDQKAAAAYLGTTVGSLNVWRTSGTHKIPYVRWGHNIRYRKEDLDAWIAEHLQNNPSCEH